MALNSGDRLLHYEIAAPIGAGGMGEVYRARDTTLGRDVAIKVLPAAFAQDPERLARFEREAKVLASLSHPGIAGIFGLHESNGVGFLAMELVPGEDLAEILKKGPLPLADALDIARQVAAALEAAHEQGVIHRDLKPANVRVTPGGVVKVLDFGLAKAMESASASDAARNSGMSPTITSLGTVAGVILGTAAYMAPEQARGKGVDKRADIWAFGCLLFEMLSGRRPFDGETISDTLAAVLAREPDGSLLPATTPSGVRHLLTRCLEKDPKRRLRDIGDARLELEEMLAARTASGRVPVVTDPVVVRSVLPRWAIGAMVGCLALGVVGGALGITRKEAPSRGVVRLELDLPADVRFTGYGVSPDGTMVAAIGAPRAAPGTAAPPTRLYLRRLDAGTMTSLANTEGAIGFGFAQDGRAIGTSVPATVGSPQRNVVYVPVDGASPPLTVCPFNPRWSTLGGLNGGGFVALLDGTELVRVSSTGTVEPPRKVDLAGERGTISFARYALPGDGAILLDAISYSERGWYYRVGVLDLKAAKVTFLFDDGGHPAYSSTGHIVFTRGDTLLAVPFDPKSLTLKGTPVALANGLRTDHGFVPAEFDLSNDGVLVHQSGGRTADERRVGVIDAAGNVTPISDERRAFQVVAADPTGGGRYVATITNGQGIDELFAGRLSEEGLRRVFAVPGADLFTPRFSRDGHTVVFGRRGRSAEDGIYVLDLDGDPAPRRIAILPPEDIQTEVEAILPDNSGVIVTRQGADQNGDIYLVPIPAPGAPPGDFKPIVTGPGDEAAAALSPDGRSIAFMSDESGRPEVYVASFGPGGAVGRAVRATRTGVAYMTWSPDGRSIRYRTGGRAMEVPVTMSPSISIGTPRELFDANAKNVRMFNFFGDGRELVMIRGENESDEIRRLSVVIGFSDELVKKMSAAR